MLAFERMLDNGVLHLGMEDFRAHFRQTAHVSRLGPIGAFWLGQVAVLNAHLGDRFSLLTREILPMITVFALTLSVGLGLALQQPILFTAEASLTVPRDQGLSFSSWSHVTGAAPDNIQGGVTQSAMDDLSSQRLIFQTIETIGLGKLYPDLAGLGADGHQEALRRVSKGLKLNQAAGSSHLTVRFSHTVPSLAALVPNTLIAAYISEHARQLGPAAEPGLGGIAPGNVAPSQVGAETPDRLRADLERQLAAKRRALYRIERDLTAQASMVHLSWQGMTNSLRADGHEHTFGFNTHYQALQIEQRRTMIAIGNLKRKIAGLGRPIAGPSGPSSTGLANGANTAGPEASPNQKPAVGLEPVRIVKLAMAPHEGRRQGAHLVLMAALFGAGLGLVTGLVLSARRTGFGSARLASQKLDLPVLTRVGVLPQGRTALSRNGFE
jgi:hypothetical protein